MNPAESRFNSPVRNAWLPGLVQRISPPPQRVAVLRASRIGDFLCATPAIRALRHGLPDSELTVLTLPLLQQLAGRLPYVDHVHPLFGFPGLAEQLFEPRRALEDLAWMQSERFDLVVQMQGPFFAANTLALLAGGPFTAGYIRRGEDSGLLDSAFPWPDEGHETERCLALVRHLGIEAYGTHIDFPVRDEDVVFAAHLLSDIPRPFIGIHAAARDPVRRWPLDRFVDTARELLAMIGGTVVVIGDAEQADASAELAASVGSSVNLADCVPLTALGAVIAHVDVLITNDSGPAHVGYAVGTPTVALVGRGNTERYGPTNGGPATLITDKQPHVPCAGQHEPDCLCLTKIQPETVVAAASDLLKVRRTCEPALQAATR